MNALLVIIPDQLSQILDKGEIQPSYYNPGQLFDEVHILMTNQDQPDHKLLRRMVGDARVFTHNLPEQPQLIHQDWWRWWKKPLRDWAAPGIELATKIKPQLIRCHGADWNAYLASRIKKALRIPYVVSLHINPDVNSVRRHLKPPLSEQQEKHNAFFEYIEETGLRNADLVMPVYQPILPYLERHGVKNVEVCYNVLNSLHLRQKVSYARNPVLRLVCVGRLIPEKNPNNIIRAVARIPDAELTIVGDGPERARLQELAHALGVSDRIIFRPVIDNDELCELLPDFDIFVVHTEYWEINKSVLEALLTGLPLIINRRKGLPVPELTDDIVYYVDNTEDAYYRALTAFGASKEEREKLGRRAFEVAHRQWDPVVTTAKYVEVYQRYMRRPAQ